MKIRRWIRLIVPGFLLAILMAVTIASSALAQECIDPATKKVIPCPAAEGGGGRDKKPTTSPYPSFTPTSTNTPTATVTPTVTITSTLSPTNTPDGAAVGKPDPAQPAPQAAAVPPPTSFDKRSLFGPIVIGSLVILIGLLLPGLRKGGSTKVTPTPPPPGKGSSGNGRDRGTIHELTKHERENLRLIQRFFDAARQGHIWSFIESEEVQRFLHDAKRGVFGGNTPDGTPGSRFPGTGAQDPLDVLDGLFRGPAFGLGRIDHSGRSDPAQASEGVEILPNGIRQTVHTDRETGDHVTIWTRPNGSIQIWTSHRDGSADGLQISPDGHSSAVHVDQTPGHSNDHNAGMGPTGTYTEVDSFPGGNAREVVTITYHVRNGNEGAPVRTVWHRGYAPAEDGRESNTARNPLHNLDVIGPRSLWAMGQALRHPGADTEQHDPNTGEGGRPLTADERERLGRIVPAAEFLDPNNGMDPVAGLHLDPSHIRTRSEDDDRIDPNTGEQPMPGGE
jgi:hypothetical protein